MSIPALRDVDNLTLARVTKALAREAVCGDDTRLRTPFTINYITNPDAEVDTTGWATYADAAGVLGAGAAITWTSSIVGAIRGTRSFRFAKDAANRQGNGVAFTFSVDAADTLRPLSIAFDCLTLTGYVAGDLSVWVYSVTDAKLLPISRNSIDASGRATIQFMGGSGVSYRLCIHVSSTSATAWNVDFDNFYVGPAYLPSSPAMSDWQDGGAITITATTTNPTKGTIVRDKVWWRRVGDSAEIRFEFYQSAGGSAGSGDYLFALPAGLSADTAKAQVNAGSATLDRGGHSLGHAGCADTGSGYSGGVVLYDATRVRLVLVTSVVSGLFAGSGAVSIGNAIRISASFTVPITGWSGSTAVQPGSRYLWAQKFAATATRVTTTPSKPGEYRFRLNTVDTAPSTLPSVANGFYFYFTTGLTQLDIYIGPGKTQALQAFLSAGRTGILFDLPFNNGINWFGLFRSYDPVTGVLSITAANAVGMNATLVTAITTCYLDILVADDPVPVALAPAVHVEASSDAGNGYIGSGYAAYEDEVADTHGAWNGSTFTAPVAGVYTFFAAYRFNNPDDSHMQAERNGADIQMGIYLGVIPSGAPLRGVCGAIRLAAGDYIRFKIVNISGTQYQNTAPSNNRMSITRIGDA